MSKYKPLLLGMLLAIMLIIITSLTYKKVIPMLSFNKSYAALTGDLNNDGIVNSIDWSYMNSKWLTSDPVADINNDGLVNSIDFSLMNANWLKTSTPPPPPPAPLPPPPPPSGSTTLNFSTYLGGSAPDSMRDMDTDSAGNIYVVGGTQSTNFPTTLGSAFNSGSCSTLGTGGTMEVFISKFSPTGQLIWSRFLGGPCYDRAYAVEIDTQGNVFVAGRAGAGFPTTSGALQTSFGGDTTPNSLYGAQDGFIAKLNSSGSVLWATYVGGNGQSIIRDIAVDSSNNVYAVKQGTMGNFPHISANAFQKTAGGGHDMAVVKLNSSGQFVWGSIYGGSGLEGQGASIRVDSSGQPVILGITDSTNLPVKNAYQSTLRGGTDFAFAKFTADGSGLIFATYFGGSANEGVETHHLALDPAGNIYGVAFTSSTNFPTTANAYQRTFGGGSNDLGIVKWSPTGQLIAATYFGIGGTEGNQGTEIDSAGNLVTFGTSTISGLATPDAYKSTVSGSDDVMVLKMSSDLSSKVYMTYFGGSGSEQGRAGAIDPQGNLIFGGHAGSGYPLLNAYDSTYGSGSYDTMVTSIKTP